MRMDRLKIPLFVALIATGALLVVYSGYADSLAGRLLGLALAATGIVKIVMTARRGPANK